MQFIKIVLFLFVANKNLLIKTKNKGGYITGRKSNNVGVAGSHMLNCEWKPRCYDRQPETILMVTMHGCLWNDGTWHWHWTWWGLWESS